ncbi:MAG: DcaP family trimeric outer membrane transporter [Defluviicoccus sp.]|nr:DcaP family trimeric outer membrane transporter [Defluviicoccus sp.]
MKRMRCFRSAVAVIGGVLLVAAVPPAGANEIEELKAQIEALQERLAKIEAAQKEAEKKTVTAGETGGWKLPGSDTSISISGYVKGDFYVDSRPNNLDYFGVYAIPLKDEKSATDDDGNVGMHARQTRLRFDTHTPTEMGALNTRIETDFYGSGNVLRLRQAYGALGPVLAGQAWSIIGDDHTYADTVDFDGPIGVIATTRTSQLRLTLPMGEGFTGQAAVEPAVKGNELPTFLGALRYSSGWGAVNLTGAVGRTDDGGQNVSAHALHAGANLNVTDATKVMATLNVARGGLNGRILGGGGGAVTVDGKLKAQESMGGFAGISHRWSDTVRSGAYFGWVENDTGDGVSAADVAGENKSLQSLHANVIWSPVPQANIGFEVMHGWREVYTAGPSEPNKGEATRVQLGVQYGF